MQKGPLWWSVECATFTALFKCILPGNPVVVFCCNKHKTEVGIAGSDIFISARVLSEL